MVQQPSFEKPGSRLNVSTGMLKNRFHIFKSPLSQRTDHEEKRISSASNVQDFYEVCFVLHNILIGLDDALNYHSFVDNFAAVRNIKRGQK